MGRRKEISLVFPPWGQHLKLFLSLLHEFFHSFSFSLTKPVADGKALLLVPPPWSQQLHTAV